MPREGQVFRDLETNEPVFIAYEDLDPEIYPQLWKPIGGFIYEAPKFLALPLPKVPFYLKDWLPKQGKAEIYGQAKAGKSFLAVQLARSIAAGDDFVGIPTNAGRVLYLQFELGQSVLQSRMAQTGQAYENVFVGTTFSMKLDTNAGQAQFTQAIVAVKPQVIILDPFYKIISGDENESKDVKKITDFLDGIIEGFDCSILILHHSGKDLSKGGRGSSLLEGWVDTYIEMKRVSKNGEALRSRLTPKLLRHAELPPEPLELILNDSFEFEQTDKIGKETVKDKVVIVLRAEKKVTGGQLISMGVGNRKSVYDALKSLIVSGRVEKEGLLYRWKEG